MQKHIPTFGRFDDLHAALYECSLAQPGQEFQKRYVLGSVHIDQTSEFGRHSSVCLDGVVAQFSFYGGVATLLLYNGLQSFSVQTDYAREQFSVGVGQQFTVAGNDHQLSVRRA